MAQTYDVVISSPFPNYEYFAHRMMDLCGQMGMTFFFVNDVWIKEFSEKLQNGEVEVRVLLDLTADQMNQDDPYTKLAYEVKRRNGYVLDDPERTAIVAHKGHLHQDLVDNKVPVPETIIVDRKDVEGFEITDEIVKRVGSPFVVKPAWGDSGIGVVVNSTSTADFKQSVKESPRSDAWLIQQQVTPKKLGQHTGWFRLYYMCGQVIPCWWDPGSHEYHLVTPGQVRHYKLEPLKRIVRGIARTAKIKKFSCEVCLDEGGNFYAVDYVNADPDMNPRSFYPNGVPDEVVRHIVWLLFSEAMRVVKRGQGFFDDDLASADMGWTNPRELEQMA
jgi:hypothetical protein